MGVQEEVDLNEFKNMLIDRKDNRIITADVESCFYNPETKKYDVKFKNGKTYSYSYNRIVWLKDPEVLNPEIYKIKHLGKELFDISSIYIFKNGYENYWHICFENGTSRDYSEKDLQIIKSCLDNFKANNVLEYLKKTAGLVSIKAEDGTKLLSKQYEKVDFVDEESALSAYLTSKTENGTGIQSVPVFPFGCNASQYRAVKSALENKISVIEGPPGTGKTQTILNIIANLIINGKTVQVVSNNNSATANILEKLSSSKYKMGFIVAPLGNDENKKKFVANQSGIYPDISDWENDISDINSFNSDIIRRSNELNDIFAKQENLAKYKLELKQIEIEEKHFEQFSNETAEVQPQYIINSKLSSSRLLRLWNECLTVSESEKEIGFFFKVKSVILYGIYNWEFYKQDISKIINTFQKLYYQARKKEIENGIKEIERELNSINAKHLTDEFISLSMKYFKGSLHKKYANKIVRPIFSEDELWQEPSQVQEEYPIVLSTTFSSRSSLGKNAVFDYVIMDEASQIDVSTGALALSCAKNAVIVGDKKQLPNVVDEDTAKKADALFNSFSISESYRFSKKSFLQSVCELLPGIPQTLLREHYRCHPKIINFCNQKFYDGKLIVMTEDNGEEDVISVIKTVKGDHERDRMNRRQIDAIKEEILPSINLLPNEIGVIAPYNNQVNALTETIKDSGIEVATVHKFQGREKDTIILTTVDDEVTDFSDDPYLLNVAVSRAKKKLCLVVSGNEQPSNSNITDLISYIEYNNLTVTESKIYSVFDYLYKQYTESRMEYLKKQKRISEYDSENLMYVLIKDILSEKDLKDLDVICHQPLNMLIRNPEYLNDEECKYAMNSATHLDFLIFNKISKKPVLAIEVDGFHYHKDGTQQAERDRMKNRILELYDIPYLRLATNGSREKEKIIEKLGLNENIDRK